MSLRASSPHTKNHNTSAGAKPCWKISAAVKIVENRSKLLEQQEQQLEKIRHLGWISLQWWGIKGRGQSLFQHISEEASSSCDSSPQRWRETKASHSTCKQQAMIPIVRHFQCIRQGLKLHHSLANTSKSLTSHCDSLRLWWTGHNTEIQSGRRVPDRNQSDNPVQKYKREDLKFIYCKYDFMFSSVFLVTSSRKSCVLDISFSHVVHRVQLCTPEDRQMRRRRSKADKIRKKTPAQCPLHSFKCNDSNVLVLRPSSGYLL